MSRGLLGGDGKAESGPTRPRPGSGDTSDGSDGTKPGSGARPDPEVTGGSPGGKLPLIVRYRPRTWDDVLGQERAVKALRSAIKRRHSKAFLLVGPSGCGKTTLARIAAEALDCLPANVQEIDAASHNDVAFWRELTVGLRYRTFGTDKQGKAVIVDECHMLSKQSWDVLLKPIEDAPPHAHWFFNTTAPGKVPKTILTRLLKLELSEVSSEDLETMLAGVVEKEGEGPPPDVLELIARSAGGSPREALTKLAACWRATDTEKAKALLRDIGEPSEEIITICRGLMRRSLSFGEALKILRGIENPSAEGFRRITRAYFVKVAMSRPDPMALAILQAFADPYPPDADLGYYITDLASLLMEGSDDAE